VRGHRRRRWWRFLALLPGVVPRDGKTKEFKMSLRRIRDHALREAGASLGSQVISSVIEYIPVRLSAVREYFVTMDLRREVLKE
jgi:hypothetical protein